MSAKIHSMRYALLAMALTPLFPATANAADKDDAEAAKVCEDCPVPSGKSGWLEVGVGVQSNDSYRFGRYTGYKDGGGSINASGEYRSRDKDGGYLNLKAEDLGLTSRDVLLEGGRQGKFGATIEYDQIPNYRESDTRSPFSSRGDGYLSLPPGWVPGGTTATMPALASDLQRTPLKTERDRLGIKFSLVPERAWELSGHFRQEEKEGTKDVGATFVFNQTVILPAPVKYRTDDFGLAMGYQSERMQARIAYDGSLFSNGYTRIAWDNPYVASSTSPSGQIAEAPDNQFHQISAVLGYQLSDANRLTARVARGRMTQDQAFLPYTVNPGLAAGTLPVDSLNGKVDTTLAKVELNSRPTHKLRLDASYTYSNRDNKTGVHTFEPVVTDVAPLGLLQNKPFSYQNHPFSFEQNLFRIKAGYRLPRDADLSLGFDHDRMNRTHQQVEETNDQTLWAKLRMHPAETVETTFKLSHAKRDASPYTPASNENPLMRAHQLANRDRDKAGLEVQLTPTDKLTLGFDFEYLKDDYGAMYLGLHQATGMNSNANLTYAFSERVSATAYYNREQLDSKQAGSAWISVPAVAVPWLASDNNLTQTVGFTLKWGAIPKKLDLAADLVYSDYSGRIGYEGSPALPELTTTMTGVGVRGVYALKDNLSLRAAYRYERYRESDWAKSAAVDAIPTLLSLGAGPQNYEVSLVTLSLRYDFK